MEMPMSSGGMWDYGNGLEKRSSALSVRLPAFRTQLCVEGSFLSKTTPIDSMSECGWGWGWGPGVTTPRYQPDVDDQCLASRFKLRAATLPHGYPNGTY